MHSSSHFRGNRCHEKAGHRTCSTEAIRGRHVLEHFQGRSGRVANSEPAPSTTNHIRGFGDLLIYSTLENICHKDHFSFSHLANSRCFFRPGDRPTVISPANEICWFSEPWRLHWLRLSSSSGDPIWPKILSIAATCGFFRIIWARKPFLFFQRFCPCIPFLITLDCSMTPLRIIVHKDVQTCSPSSADPTVMSDRSFRPEFNRLHFRFCPLVYLCVIVHQKSLSQPFKSSHYFGQTPPFIRLFPTPLSSRL